MAADAKTDIKWFGEAKQVRAPYENDWRMAAAYCVPRHYSSWQTEGPAQINNDAAKRFAYDATGVKSVPKFVAIMNRILTPEGQRWHKLMASDTSLMKSYNVRMYFDTLTDKLFKMRYQPRARFQLTRGEVYTSLGVYGTGPYSITWRKPSPLDAKGGFLYKAWPLRNIYILVDDDGIVRAIFRRFWVNGRQFREKFGEVEAPASIQQELVKAGGPSETNYFEFAHVLAYRDDYDPSSLSVRRHAIRENYISVRDQQYVGKEGGYACMPMPTPRLQTEPGDTYGYSPAQLALPALGGASATKKTIIKQGQKAVDPVILSANDGVLSGRVDNRPGAVNPGGVDKQGRKLVQTLEAGNFQVAEKILEGERADIEDAFFVSVFKALVENQNMTATQAMQLIADQAAQLAPAMGRLQSEDVGPGTEREIALLAENGELPEMPPELVEAKGEYEMVYTSPLAKSQYAESVTGYLRLQEMLVQKTTATGDPAPLDWLNDDAAVPEIGDYLSVYTRWIADPAAVAKKRAARAQQQQQQALLKQAPAAASIFNSAAKTGNGADAVAQSTQAITGGK